MTTSRGLASHASMCFTMRPVPSSPTYVVLPAAQPRQQPPPRLLGRVYLHHALVPEWCGCSMVRTQSLLHGCHAWRDVMTQHGTALWLPVQSCYRVSLVIRPGRAAVVKQVCVAAGPARERARNLRGRAAIRVWVAVRLVPGVRSLVHVGRKAGKHLLQRGRASRAAPGCTGTATTLSASGHLVPPSS